MKHCKNAENPELVVKGKAETQNQQQAASESSSNAQPATKPTTFHLSAATHQGSQPAQHPGRWTEALERHVQNGATTHLVMNSNGANNDGGRNQILFDTGSDIYVTNDFSDLYESEILPPGRFPIITGGGVVHPTHVRAAKYKFTSPDGTSAQEVTLEMVLVLPYFPLKIFSGERFLLAGGSLTRDGVLVRNDGLRITALNPPVRGCFLWEFGKPEPNKRTPAVQHIRSLNTTHDDEHLRKTLQAHQINRNTVLLPDEVVRLLVLWHRRLVHCSAERLRWTLQETTGIELALESIKSLPCEACDQAKITKVSSHDPSPPASYADESIHFDIGEIKPISVDGNRYFMLLTDRFSRHRNLSCHQTKATVVDEIIDHLTERKARLERINRTIENMHIDGARELTNEGISNVPSRFETFCRQHQIRLTVSSAQNHHQNPYSKRGIRVLQDAARAVGIQMKIPSVFWDRLLEAVAYVTNRTASSSMEGKVPLRIYEKSMSGEDPVIDVSHLRILGSVCTAFVEPSERVSVEKLAPRGVRGILLSFAGNHNYLMWLIDGGRWLRTPNIVFREQLDSPPTGPGTPEPADPRDVVRSLPEAVQRRLRHRTKPRSSIRPKDLNVVDEDQTDDESHVQLKRGRPKRQVRQVYEAHTDSPELIEELRTVALVEDRELTLRQALRGPEVGRWEEALRAELIQLLERSTFDFRADPTKQKKLVTSKWVLFKKLNSDGEVAKFKARLVARGFTQRYLVDYENTFSSTARSATWRILLAVEAAKGWKVVQADFKGAYLNGDLEEEIWMMAPEWMDEFFASRPDLEKQHGYAKGQPILLKRPLYGLKPSGNAWQKKIRSLLAAEGVFPLVSDSATLLHEVIGEFTKH